MKVRSIFWFETLLAGGFIIQGVAAIVLATTIPDLPPGWVTLLVAIIGLATAWNAVRLQQVHKAVNSTATVLKEESKNDKETVIRLAKENAELKTRLNMMEGARMLPPKEI